MRRTHLLQLLVLVVATLGITETVYAGYTAPAKNSAGVSSLPSADSAGIKEIIPAKFQKRYDEWKSEFLSADISRQQWDMYARNSRFVLTITINDKNETGAGSGKYKWNDAGELVAATITLGSKLDQGYPSVVYYPVMTALRPFQTANVIDGSVLAAAKLAHEFGHILKISTTPKDLYHLQQQMVPIYNEIFLHNGYNVTDPRLVEIARKMGGTPVEIWQDREYWGEANAMLFLRDRVAKEKYHCRLFGKIREIVEEYAKDYEQRFAEIAKSQDSSSCSWR